MGVIFEELAGSPTVSYTRGEGGKAKQILRCAWADQNALLAQFFPSPYILGSNIVIPPAAVFPGAAWMVAKTADIEPWDPENPNGHGEFPNYYPGGARVTINYETPEYDQSNPQADGPEGNTEITFVSYKVSISGEFLTYPSSALRWDQPSDQSLSDNPSNPIAPKFTATGDDTMASVIIPMLEHTLTWPQVAFPPWTAIRSCIGKVNAYTFCGAPPETLLFLGCEASRDITSEGIRCWNIEYKFSEKNQNPLNPLNPQGWNYFLRPDGQQAGTFMRMRRRVNLGYTSLSAVGAIGSNTIVVNNPGAFPRAAPFVIQLGPIAGGLYDITAGFGTNTWTTQQILAQNYPVGTQVVQLKFSTLSANVGYGATTIKIADANALPGSNVGQYLITVGNPALFGFPDPNRETMAVIGGQGTNTLTVLRAVSGTRLSQHNTGDWVYLNYSNVYDLADFSTLFLSGLITG